MRSEKSNIEEYSQNVLITLKCEISYSADKIEIASKIDPEDLNLYCYFNSSTEGREIESERDIDEDELKSYCDELDLLWDRKCKEKKENEKIRERNSELWIRSFEEEREFDKSRPKTLFWPFG